MIVFFHSLFIVLRVYCCAMHHAIFMDIMWDRTVSVQGITNEYISFLFFKISFKIYLLAYHTP
ncbi:hypothetical protein EC412_18405 [Salmonella enterica subsp. enterica serovar Redlands]|nr:hypothetical protein [Salmonella enterica subsp. enterica serovar Redlands]